MYAAFERALSEAVERGAIAGAVALTVDRDGAAYEHAAGVRAAGGAAVMTPDTIFWIASMTKAVSSVAALQLVEQGRLSLDRDLAALLPELAALEVLEGIDADGKPRLRPARGAMTLRRLLSHTSGFAYSFTHPDLVAYAAATGRNLNDGTRAAHRQPLAFDPGEGWIYGIGVDWAGIAIEAASGQRLDAYMRDHIFEPLGMADTGYAVDPAREGRRASVHVRGEAGLAALPLAPSMETEVVPAGGGLHSTAHDYGRFLRMLLNGGELEGRRVLSEATVRSLAQVQSGPHRAGAWKTSMPHLSHDFDPYPGMATGHGLACVVTPEATGDGRAAGSLGWAGLANTYYWADPASGKAGVLLTQLLPFGDPEVLGLFRRLERSAYGLA